MSKIQDQVISADAVLRSCGTCKFSQLQPPPPGQIHRQRVCLRFPPHITMVPIDAGGGRMGIVGNVGFPIVQDAMFCYEYAPQEPKLTLAG